MEDDCSNNTTLDMVKADRLAYEVPAAYLHGVAALRRLPRRPLPKMQRWKDVKKCFVIPIGFMILVYLFESYLDSRQHAALKLTNLPKSLVGVITQEKFEKSRAYSLDKSYFHFVHEFVAIFMNSTILYFGILPWFWKRCGEFLVYAGLNTGLNA